MGNQASVGSVVGIGKYRVEIVKQLGEGGFAYVFLVKPYAVKRLLVNDKEDLGHVREEINVMKSMPKHKNVVMFKAATIVNSKQSRGGSEVYIMMEFCQGPSLYGYLDERFGNPLPEQEILGIFSDVCEAVYHLHMLDPPLAHRDLKVENVLRHQSGNWKLCDFGSSTTVTQSPSSRYEINAAEDEIGRHTTMSYRAPEMLDLYSGKLINEKVDVWALGCMLYRLCFMVHPFEESKLAILNCNYAIPPSSGYSTELHEMIKFMLNPNPDERPDIYQVLVRLSQIRNVQCPVQNPSALQSRAKSHTPSPTPKTTGPQLSSSSLSSSACTTQHRGFSTKNASESSNNRVFAMLGDTAETSSGLSGSGESSMSSFDFHPRSGGSRTSKDSSPFGFDQPLAQSKSASSSARSSPTTGDETGGSNMKLFEVLGANALQSSAPASTVAPRRPSPPQSRRNQFSSQPASRQRSEDDMMTPQLRPMEERSSAIGAIKTHFGGLSTKMANLTTGVFGKVMGSQGPSKDENDNDDEFWANLDREKEAERRAAERGRSPQPDQFPSPSAYSSPSSMSSSPSADFSPAQSTSESASPSRPTHKRSVSSTAIPSRNSSNSRLLDQLGNFSFDQAPAPGQKTQTIARTSSPSSDIDALFSMPAPSTATSNAESTAGNEFPAPRAHKRSPSMPNSLSENNQRASNSDILALFNQPRSTTPTNSGFSVQQQPIQPTTSPHSSLGSVSMPQFGMAQPFPQQPQNQAFYGQQPPLRPVSPSSGPPAQLNSLGGGATNSPVRHAYSMGNFQPPTTTMAPKTHSPPPTKSQNSQNDIFGDLFK